MPLEMSSQPLTKSAELAAFDCRNADWYIDKLVQYVVFLSGISAIILIVGIFVFVTIEGFGFLLEDFSFSEFFLSQWWEPTDDDEPGQGCSDGQQHHEDCAGTGYPYGLRKSGLSRGVVLIRGTIQCKSLLSVFLEVVLNVRTTLSGWSLKRGLTAIA